MSRGVASRAVRALTLVLVAALLVSGLSSAAPGAESAVQPAAQCGFADGGSDPTVTTHRHDFGEVVVGRTGTKTVAAGGVNAGGSNADSVVTVGGPDAGQFRARTATETATGEDETLRVSFAPTAPGPKRAWVVVTGDATTVHCLVGTAVVAGASKGGSESDGAGDGRGADGREAGGAAVGSAGSGGGKLTDAVRGFGREFVGSVTRGVVSVVTLEFARDAAVGAGAAWAAGDGVLGKALGVAGYTLSGIDPTSGLRNGLPAALAAWRAGDFEGAGRALFGVVESVVFTGAAAAGAWEGSKRARKFAHDRRGAATEVDGVGAPSTAEYRAFTGGIDAVLAAGFGGHAREDAGEASVGDDPTVGGDGAAGRASSSEEPMSGGGSSPANRPGAPDGEGPDTADGVDRDDRRELA
ncbi:hypothetical protein C2R22_09440 [Salinigranum rubrum]|uniref:Uncharacterized protein n=1 Tax=Salinigranum rubrum TaxID=755307 RepID=A0A2I8VIS4_9EURY|nr:hypothetical protein [Salinigranum rubrum]AUV81843.1 hypothetical protein C2R22_09440 [Salinigranum rubrum]